MEQNLCIFQNIKELKVSMSRGFNETINNKCNTQI